MVRNTKHSAAVALRLARRGIVRAREFGAAGVPRTTLQRLEAKGQLRRVGRGLYTIAALDTSAHHSLAVVAKRVPSEVVCLLSALQFHRLGTQAPFEVWIAVGVKAHRPASDFPPLRVVRYSGKALTFGVETHSIEGVPVRITSAAKTVADCFKYRNKIGLDVALEALREYRRSRRHTIDALMRAATVCRVANVMRPYLEAIQ